MQRTALKCGGSTPKNDAVKHARGPHVATASNTFVATAENFLADVVAASSDVPVLVDFWAPWCAPCHQLMPVLERLAAEYGDRLRLAKVNTEEQQALAGQIGIRSLPTVALFKGGAVVDHFMGAMPEKDVRKWLERHLPAGEPAPGPLAAARALKSDGDLAGARLLLDQALAATPDDVELTAERGEVLALAGDLEAARTLLESLRSREPAHTATRRLAAVIAFRDVVAAHPDARALAATVAGEPANVEARHALAVHELLRGDAAAALGRWLAIMRERPADGDGLARHSLLEAFALLGESDPLVGVTRREMARLLF
jgi:putative thioredoxin